MILCKILSQNRETRIFRPLTPGEDVCVYPGNSATEKDLLSIILERIFTSWSKALQRSKRCDQCRNRLLVSMELAQGATWGTRKEITPLAVGWNRTHTPSNRKSSVFPRFFSWKVQCRGYLKNSLVCVHGQFKLGLSQMLEIFYTRPMFS